MIETFSIFRPSLAQELSNNGINPVSVQQSIVDGRTIWVFTRTPETAEIITAYYNDLGKPVPRPVQRYTARLNEQRANNG